MPGSFAVARRELYAELPSTQDRAVELAREGAEEGSVVVARHQSRGRGRGDRGWASPVGGLYLSVVLRTPPAAVLLPLAIGAEVADALLEEYRVRLRLKWPNDLVAVDGAGTCRKLAGVLVDVVGPAAPGAPAIAGIGVNALPPVPPWPDELRGGAVALGELTEVPVDLERLESVVAGAVVRARRALGEATGARSTVARARGLLYGAGEAVSVDGVPVGRLRGLRDDGALEVAGSDGAEFLLAGDLRVGVGA
jgi:BirA family transcriptional regulator, biotin operon repressor / biotin---[acetyl-CoA-carboxylase] ligase